MVAFASSRVCFSFSTSVLLQSFIVHCCCTRRLEFFFTIDTDTGLRTGLDGHSLALCFQRGCSFDLLFDSCILFFTTFCFTLALRYVAFASSISRLNGTQSDAEPSACRHLGTCFSSLHIIRRRSASSI
jgi:hypothetical protein